MKKKTTMPKRIYVARESDGSEGEEFLLAGESPKDIPVDTDSHRIVGVYQLVKQVTLKNTTVVSE